MGVRECLTNTSGDDSCDASSKITNRATRRTECASVGMRSRQRPGMAGQITRHAKSCGSYARAASFQDDNGGDAGGERDEGDEGDAAPPPPAPTGPLPRGRRGAAGGTRRKGQPRPPRPLRRLGSRNRVKPESVSAVGRGGRASVRGRQAPSLPQSVTSGRRAAGAPRHA